MKKLLLTLFLATGTLANAAGGQEPMQFYTPNTYAFARYGDLPVDHSTGIPRISLPLTSISDRDITVDVSLSYYASGIKVDQEASWVGLGWSLNAGGVITCQTRGVPDKLDAKTGKMDRTLLRFRDYPDETIDQFIDSERHKWVSAADIRPDGCDAAPDIFYFNYCGRTGKFYLDENGKGCMVNQDDSLIEFQPDGTFKITDEKGFVYLFKDKEYAYYEPIKQNSTSGWYLSSITSPAGGSITFAYAEGGTLSTSIVYRVDDTCCMTLHPDVASHSIPPSYLRPAISYNSGRGITGLVLSRITASSGACIDFACSTQNRKDAFSVKGSMLETITARNSAGAVYKKYKLAYSYFKPDARHRIEAAYYEPLNNRLRLDTVTELASEGTDALPPYRFSYYGDGGPESDNIYALPYRMSPCQDHWGYYNHSDNKTIFPGNAANEPFFIDPWYQQWASDREWGYLNSYGVTGGANRDLHKEAVKACTLNKIVYPTGGSTEFEFEAHDAEQVLGRIGMGGLRVKRITDDDGNGHQKVRSYTYPLSYSWGNSRYHLTDNLYHLWYYQETDLSTHVGHCRDYLPIYGFLPHMLDENHLLQITSFPVLALGIEGDFMYPDVTEHVEGQGRTEYAYTYAENQVPPIPSGSGLSAPDWMVSTHISTFTDTFTSPTISCQTTGPDVFPFLTGPDLGWKRGQLKERKVYDESGNLLEADYNTYEETLLGVEPGAKAIQITDYEFLFGKDYLTSGRARLTKETHTVYDDNGKALRTTREYTYAPGFHKLVSEVKETTSEGDEWVTKYYYPHDYTATASHAELAAMKTKRILQPVDVRRYKDGLLVSGGQTKYNANGQPEVVYIAETTKSDIAFSARNPYTFTPVHWLTYDANRLLVSERLRDGNLKYAYLWSYGNQYPVARIEGAEYSEVAGWLNAASVALPNSLTSPAQIGSRLASIRSALSGKDVLVTTCTYMPQVGMLETTGAGGTKSGYGYDAFRRLSQVTEHNGKPVSEYRYNFKQ